MIFFVSFFLSAVVYACGVGIFTGVITLIQMKKNKPVSFVFNMETAITHYLLLTLIMVVMLSHG